ncbi:MAG: hypothetical protein KGJ89_01380 [Patescibacteria group bacterium]|nr:hypothetical protein [Patescibacteria group bacterium]MDE2015164.1 hypothetical protein [Patescibacteria group bacterium]MDE2226592.1 hypothetical protein [Patescibacteria group bacterium]
MSISKGRIALLIGLGVVLLGIFVLIFFFQRRPSVPTPSGNELSAAGTQGVQFTFGGQNPVVGSSGSGSSGGQGSLFFQQSSQSAGPGTSVGNAFLPSSGNGVRISSGGNTNTGVGGGGISIPTYTAPSLSDLINKEFPSGINALSVLNDLGNVGSVISSQDPYIQGLITQYQQILAEQQQLRSLAQTMQQNAPVIPADLIQGVSNGQVTLSLSAMQNLLNNQASTTAAFNEKINIANSQLSSILNSQISQAQSAGISYPGLQSALSQVDQFNSSTASFDQQASTFNSQTTNLINQFLANSSGTMSQEDLQNLLSQLNASTTAMQQQMSMLENQATSLTNTLSFQ